ncbi:hypothetical protein ACFPRL_16485 [Pseudoclavibacter helvolus]
MPSLTWAMSASRPRNRNSAKSASTPHRGPLAAQPRISPRPASSCPCTRAQPRSRRSDARGHLALVVSVARRSAGPSSSWPPAVKRRLASLGKPAARLIRATGAVQHLVRRNSR